MRAPEGVVLEEEAAVLDDDVGLGLALVRGAGDGGDDLAVAVDVDDDAVLGELLLDEDDLLGALDDKVAARVEGALPEAREALLRLPLEGASVAAEHDRHVADLEGSLAVLALAHDDLLPAGVLDVDGDGGRVGDVPEAALLRRDLLDDVLLLVARLPDVDVEVLEVEVRDAVDRHALVALRAHDLLYLVVDEVVERVDVLLDEAADLEERRQELVLVLDRPDRGRHLGRVLQEQLLHRSPAWLLGCLLLLLLLLHHL